MEVIAHFKPFPGLKVKQMDHHDIPVLEECQYDAAAIHVDINDLLKSRTNIDVNEITKGIINIFLRYRSHNIAKIVYSVYTVIRRLHPAGSCLPFRQLLSVDSL